MKTSVVALTVVLLSGFISTAQNKIAEHSFVAMCYNVENLFDCKDDSLKDDAEFLPDGSRHWTLNRYRSKQHKIAQVIAAIGGWEAPDLVGLCEVENRAVLTDLTRRSPLKRLGYEFLHFESPDRRGIDVALLYQAKRFKPFQAKPVRVSFPEQTQASTRDILLVSGILPTKDSLHVFICHFPSRLGGQLASETRRKTAAARLRSQVDSLFALNPRSKILIMGDFNDSPEDSSLREVLRALKPEGKVDNSQLYNLTYPLHSRGKGSHKHDGIWSVLDHFIVSGNLLDSSQKFYIRPEEVSFFEADFLLEQDTKDLGTMPFRTYQGMIFKGGFSDHLPVYGRFSYR